MKGLAAGVHKQPYKMKIPPLQLGGELQSGNHFQPNFPAMSQGPLHPVHGVVIGNGQSRKTLLGSQLHQLFGGEGTIGKTGMGMQIRKFHQVLLFCLWAIIERLPIGNTDFTIHSGKIPWDAAVDGDAFSALY